MLPLLLLVKHDGGDELLRSLLLERDKRVFKEGHSYFLREKKPKKGFSYLLQLIDEGYCGLYVTRRHPDHIERKHGSGYMRIVWLSTTLGRDYVDPHNLGSLTNLINSFVEENRKSVILLDGLEYLMINNDFQRVLKFVEYLNEIIMQKKSLLIVSIDERAFDPRELALLERNADEIGS